MRKALRLALTLALCAALAALAAGCSQPDSVEGRWTVMNAYDTGSNEAAGGTDVENTFGYVIVYDFQQGGKLVASLEDQDVEGTWTQDGNKVTIDLNGSTGTGEVVEDTMTLKYNEAILELERS